jgi:hypothetical protein
MTITKDLIEYIFELESHEVEELKLLLEFVRGANREIYKEVKIPIKKLIKDTISHIDDLHFMVDEIRS